MLTELTTEEKETIRLKGIELFERHRLKRGIELGPVERVAMELGVLSGCIAMLDALAEKEQGVRTATEKLRDAMLKKSFP